VNLEKLKVSFRKSCLYHLRKLTTPFRSSRSQSKHQHGSLPKVDELFVTALSEQDVAKSHDNDVFVFDSSSAILKMERRREDELKSTAHEQRFFRRAWLHKKILHAWAYYFTGFWINKFLRQGVNKEFQWVNSLWSHRNNLYKFFLNLLGHVADLVGFLTWDPSLVWNADLTLILK